MYQLRICQIIFDDAYTFENTIKSLVYLVDAVRDKDDPLEGIVFQCIALLDIHSSRRSATLRNDIMSKFPMNAEYKSLYENVAIKTALTDIQKFGDNDI